MTTITFPTVNDIVKLNEVTIAVTSPASEAQARTHLAKIRAASKQLAADIKALKAPHKAAIDAIEAAAAPWKAELAAQDEALERAILVYQRQVREAAQKANQKALEKFEQKVEKLEQQAIDQGKPMPLVVPPAMRAEPAKTIVADGSTQTTVRRKAWRLAKSAGHAPEEITADLAHVYGLPLAYFKLDTVKIGKVIRAGGAVPGVEVYEEESLAIR